MHCARAACVLQIGAPYMLDHLPCGGQGYEVHVIVDGVSSQRLGDRAVAIQVLGILCCCHVTCMASTDAGIPVSER